MSSLKLVYSKKEPKPKKKKEVEREITVDERLAIIAESLETTHDLSMSDALFLRVQNDKINAMSDELEDDVYNRYQFIHQIKERFQKLQKRKHLKLVE